MNTKKYDVRRLGACALVMLALLFASRAAAQTDNGPSFIAHIEFRGESYQIQCGEHVTINAVVKLRYFKQFPQKAQLKGNCGEQWKGRPVIPRRALLTYRRASRPDDPPQPLASTVVPLVRKVPDAMNTSIDTVLSVAFEDVTCPRCPDTLLLDVALDSMADCGQRSESKPSSNRKVIAQWLLICVPPSIMPEPKVRIAPQTPKGKTPKVKRGIASPIALDFEIDGTLDSVRGFGGIVRYDQRVFSSATIQLHDSRMEFTSSPMSGGISLGGSFHQPSPMSGNSGPFATLLLQPAPNATLGPTVVTFDSNFSFVSGAAPQKRSGATTAGAWKHLAVTLEPCELYVIPDDHAAPSIETGTLSVTPCGLYGGPGTISDAFLDSAADYVTALIAVGDRPTGFAIVGRDGSIGPLDLPFTPTDRVTILVADAADNADSAALTVSAPAAVDDTARARGGDSTTIDVAANDRLGATMYVGTPVWTARGTAATLADGRIRYTAPAGFTGRDTVVYAVLDSTCYDAFAMGLVIVDVTSSAGIGTTRGSGLGLFDVLGSGTAHPVIRLDAGLDAGAEGRVRIDLFDAHGALVETTIDAPATTGARSIPLDALCPACAALPAGLYVCRLSSGSRVESRTLVLVR